MRKNKLLLLQETPKMEKLNGPETIIYLIGIVNSVAALNSEKIYETLDLQLG